MISNKLRPEQRQQRRLAIAADGRWPRTMDSEDEGTSTAKKRDNDKQEWE
jgi:hypothetical protein